MKLSAVMFTLVAAGLVAAAPTPESRDLSPPDGYGTDLPGDIKRSPGEDPLHPNPREHAISQLSKDNDKRGDLSPPDGYGTDLPGDIKRRQDEVTLPPTGGDPQPPTSNDNDKRGKVHWGHGPAKTSPLDYPSPPKDN